MSHPLPPSSRNPGWQIDKTIPLAVVVGLLSYGVTVVWYVADQASHMTQAERRIAALEDNSRETRLATQTIADKVSGINEKMGRTEERSLFILDRMQSLVSSPQSQSNNRNAGSNR